MSAYMFHSKECVNNVRVKMFNFLKKNLGCFEFFLLLAMMTPQNAIAFKHVARYVQELCESLSARRDSPKDATIAQRLSRQSKFCFHDLMASNW